MKQIVCVNKNGRWDVEFHGPVTQRDVNSLQRLLRVNYSRHRRKRSFESKAQTKKEQTHAKEPESDPTESQS